ncbi:Anthocyanidin 3-O-glucosyltransferase [Bertholletia excelsa]
MESSKLHAVILSSPGMGHLIPVLQLGKRLIANHGLQVTILVVSTIPSPSLSHLLHPSTIPKLLSIVELPPVDISNRIDPDAKLVTRISVTMRAAQPAIKSTLSAMQACPTRTMFIADFFGTEALHIADEFRIPKYLFVPSNAWFAALTSYCHELDKEISGPYVERREPLRLPGCRPVRPNEVVDPMLDRTDQQYREYVRVGIDFSLADGLLINTWEDLERKSLVALRGDEIIKVPIYPIGPLTKPVEESGSHGELFKWLDVQPEGSVIFVSFGSGGTISGEQSAELAWGLEMSRQRFIWVARRPIEGSADASYFKSTDDPDGALLDFMQEGFLTRTRHVGKVVLEWAPQMRILGHPSVGGFLSHCGWNSILESLTNGVPMIAWPLYAEQRMNATLLVEELGVAVRPSEQPAEKVVGREEIEEMVRRVMESEQGKAMRQRVKELRCSAEEATREGGSSHQSMCNLIRECRMKLDSIMQCSN